MSQDFWTDFEKNISGDKIPKLFNLIKVYFDDKNNLKKNKYFSLDEEIEEENHYKLFKNIFGPLINKIQKKITWFTVFFYDEIHKNHDFVIFFPNSDFKNTSFNTLYNLANYKSYYTKLDNSSSLLFKESNKQQIERKLLYLTYSESGSFYDFDNLAYKPVNILNFEIISGKIKTIKQLIADSDETYEKLNNGKLDYLSNSDFYSQFEPVVSSRSKKIFRYFYWLTLLRKEMEFNHYYYFPASLLSKRSVGGIVIATKSKFSKNDLILCQSSSNRVFSLLSNQALGEYSRQAFNYSTKSAIAAIMSRNGSHNIGSHVLSALSYNLNDPVDMQVFSQYLQQRMDFIAQITTEIPAWTIPTRFVSQLMRNFYMQRILLKYIVESEGLTAREYTGIDSSGNGKLQIIIEDNEGNEITGGTSKDKVPEQNDPFVAVPGGITGTHAFYTILENIIRNAAKHSYLTSSAEGLRMFLRINDINDTYVSIQIYDNVTKFNSSLFKTLKKNLNTSFIDDNGSLIYKAWGIAEMKIGAGYLNKVPFDIISGGNEKEIIKFIEVKKITREDQCYIGYEVKIPKPKQVLIIDNTRHSNNWSKDGIYIKNEITENDNFDYEFITLKNLDIEIFTKIRNKLPARVLICHTMENVPDSKYIKLKDPNICSQIDQKNTTGFVNKLYECWVNKIMAEKKLDNVSLVINPIDNGSQGGTSLNDDKIYRVAINELLKENLPIIGNGLNKLKEIITDKNIAITKDFFDQPTNDRSEYAQYKTEIISRFDKIKSFYNKYLEDIESLPKNLIFNKKNSSNNRTVTVNFGEGKITTAINYTRHKGEDSYYSEALSGSQSYFNSILNFVMNEDVKNSKLKYGLIENGLIHITIIDERVYKYYTEACQPKVKKRFDSIKLTIGNLINEKLVFSNGRSPGEIFDRNIKNKGDILIIHQGILDKKNILRNSGEWGYLKQNFTYLFVTSGRGKPERDKLPSDIKFIPFSNIRASLMQQYPEKYLLIQSLFKI